MSLSNWANRWGVSKDKARNFLVLLEKDGMITHESLGKTTRITICNYDDYQGNSHDSQTLSHFSNNDSQTASHTNKNDKNNKNDNNSSKETAKRFTPPSIEEVQFYISEKGYSVDAERFVSFYECKGWYVGKNKMKNWKAAITTWSKSEKSKMSNIKTSSSTQNVNDIWNQK